MSGVGVQWVQRVPIDIDARGTQRTRFTRFTRCTAKLYVNEKVVAEGPMRTQPGKFTLSGDGLCIGRDSGDNVSQEYETPGEFTGGTILGVAVSVGKEQYLNLEKMAAAAFAVE